MWSAKHTFVYYENTKAETSEGFSPLSCLLDLCCWSESPLCWWLLELLTDLHDSAPRLLLSISQLRIQKDTKLNVSLKFKRGKKM